MSLNDKLMVKEQKQNPKLVKYEINNENHFEKVEIPNNFKTNKINNCENENVKKSGTVQQSLPSKAQQQRKCLIDISNINTEANEP